MARKSAAEVIDQAKAEGTIVPEPAASSFPEDEPPEATPARDPFVPPTVPPADDPDAEPEPGENPPAAEPPEASGEAFGYASDDPEVDMLGWRADEAEAFHAEHGRWPTPTDPLPDRTAPPGDDAGEAMRGALEQAVEQRDAAEASEPKRPPAKRKGKGKAAKEPRQTSAAPRGTVDGDEVFDEWMGIPITRYSIVVTAKMQCTRAEAEALLKADGETELKVTGRVVAAVHRTKKGKPTPERDDGRFVELQATFHSRNIDPTTGQPVD